MGKGKLWAALAPCNNANVCSLGSDRRNPVPNSLSNELRAVVRPDVGRNAAQDEQVRQRIDYVCRVQLALHPDRQAFPAVFIQDVQCPERLPVIGPVMHEVVRPNVVAIPGTQPDT